MKIKQLVWTEVAPYGHLLEFSTAGYGRLSYEVYKNLRGSYTGGLEDDYSGDFITNLSSIEDAKVWCQQHLENTLLQLLVED